MKIPFDYKILTTNYTLRAPSEFDFSAIFSVTRYPGFNDGMLWDPPKNLAELRSPLKNNIQAWKDGIGYGFTIDAKNTQSLVGRISIRKTDEEGVWNVGFWTHPKMQRKGIMTEALAAILKFGFENLSAKRIEACHALWNTGSEKVLTNNGFVFVKYLEKGFLKNGKWVEENMLAIKLEDWRRR